MFCSFSQSGVKEREREARSETLRRLQAFERQNRLERRYESKMHRRSKRLDDSWNVAIN